MKKCVILYILGILVLSLIVVVQAGDLSPEECRNMGKGKAACETGEEGGNCDNDLQCTIQGLDLYCLNGFCVDCVSYHSYYGFDEGICNYNMGEVMEEEVNETLEVVEEEELLFAEVFEETTSSILDAYAYEVSKPCSHFIDCADEEGLLYASDFCYKNQCIILTEEFVATDNINSCFEDSQCARGRICDFQVCTEDGNDNCGFCVRTETSAKFNDKTVAPITDTFANIGGGVQTIFADEVEDLELDAEKFERETNKARRLAALADKGEINPEKVINQHKKIEELGIEFDVNKEKIEFKVDGLTMEKKLQFQNTINSAEDSDEQNKFDLVTTIEKFEQNKEINPALLKVTQELKIQQVNIESKDGSIEELKQSKMLEILNGQASSIIGSGAPVLPGQQSEIDLSQLSLQRSSRNSISIDQSKLERTQAAALQETFGSLQSEISTTEDVDSTDSSIPAFTVPSSAPSSLPIVPSSSEEKTPSFIPTGLAVKYLFGF